MTYSVTTYLILRDTLDEELLKPLFISNNHNFVTASEGDDELKNTLHEFSHSEYGTAEVCMEGLQVKIIKNSVKDYFDAPTLSIRVSEQAFKSNSSEKNVDIYIEIVQGLIGDISPLYGFGAFLVEEHLDVERPPFKEDINNGDIDELFWLNYYSPELASELGPDHLLENPVWLVEKLSDGGVFLVTMPNPVGPGDDYDMHIEAADYLGFNPH